MPTCWRRRPTWSVQSHAQVSDVSNPYPTREEVGWGGVWGSGRKEEGREGGRGIAYVVFLLVDLVRGHVFGRGKTRGGVRVGVAFCDFWVRC